MTVIKEGDQVDTLPVQVYGKDSDGRPVPFSVAGFNIPLYDEIDFTYVTSGNGQGKVETITFSKEDTELATLTFTYDSNDKVTKVTKS